MGGSSSCRMKRVTSPLSSRSSAGRRRVGKRAWRVWRVGFAAWERGMASLFVVGEEGREGLGVRVEMREVRKMFDWGMEGGREGDIWGRKGGPL